jgi:hypothetical protein
MKGAFISINRGVDRNKLRKIEVASESGTRERVRLEFQGWKSEDKELARVPSATGTSWSS